MRKVMGRWSGFARAFQVNATLPGPFPGAPPQEMRR